MAAPFLGLGATDIGSITAHGSIVARAYGIPAVLGTGNGTRLVEHGQRIKVDGDRGLVTILEDAVRDTDTDWRKICPYENAA